MKIFKQLSKKDKIGYIGILLIVIFVLLFSIVTVTHSFGSIKNFFTGLITSNYRKTM